jgi:hypothetical protein
MSVESPEESARAKEAYVHDAIKVWREYRE